MKKILSLLVVLVLMSGLVFAFIPMDKTVTINKFGYNYAKSTNSYYVKLSGAGYATWGESPWTDGNTTSINPGFKQILKDGTKLEFKSVAYNCTSVFSKKDFVAFFDLCGSNIPNYCVSYDLGLQKGDSIIITKTNGKMKLTLEYLTVPSTTILTESFYSNDLVNASLCDKDEPLLVGSPLNTYLENMDGSPFMQLWETVYFIKPKQAYAILKITELN
ncbi:MAG: hypothetical protein PHH82_04295 [Candidatus ainarchaeum sp.]|nr:hypothetical protein [Candidatus ainarchaeum sp.]